MGEPMRGTAVVVAASNPDRGGRADDGEATLLDGAVDLIRKDRWDLVLDIEPAVGEPFRWDGRAKVVKRLGGLRRALKDWTLLPGMTLPVVIGKPPRGRVAVDWDVWVAVGGLDLAIELTEEHRAVMASTHLATMMRKDRRLRGQQREQALRFGPEMARQVPAGVRPAHEFSRWVLELEAGGAVSRDEANALRREAELPEVHG